MRKLTWILLAVFALVSLAPVTSFASASGRRNTAIVLSGAALGAWLHGGHSGVPALILSGAAAYAWNREHQAALANRYRTSYYYGGRYGTGGYYGTYGRGRYYRPYGYYHRGRYYRHYGHRVYNGGHWYHR